MSVPSRCVALRRVVSLVVSLVVCVCVCVCVSLWTYEALAGVEILHRAGDLHGASAFLRHVAQAAKDGTHVAGVGRLDQEVGHQQRHVLQIGPNRVRCSAHLLVLCQNQSTAHDTRHDTRTHNTRAHAHTNRRELAEGCVAGGCVDHIGQSQVLHPSGLPYPEGDERLTAAGARARDTTRTKLSRSPHKQKESTY